MVAVVLAVGSALCWGSGDFLGGVAARRLPTLAVVLGSQLAGGAALVAVVAATGASAGSGAGVAWGALSGVLGAGALLAFYRGLAVGPMSVVAPVSACGVAVPVVVALARGDVPSAVTGAGLAVAFAGVVLVSRPAVLVDAVVHPRLGVTLALAAALGFGLFFVVLDRATAEPAVSPLWVVLGARIGGLTALGAATGVAAVRGRLQPAAWSAGWTLLFGVGALDTAANVLFAYATTEGNLAVVSVLGSLYPVATVALARLVLSERLARMHAAGVVLALTGVGLVAAG